jgi:D-alanine-D-alanine ligase
MTSSDRVRLVVLFGGQSAEHEVSCTTAAHVLAAADRERYEIEPVGITRDGTWVRSDDAVAALAQGVREFPGSVTAAGTAIEPMPTVTPATVDDLPVVVLPLLHGPHGEDGTVQGMLELAGVPYVGSGVLASALCMDKLKAKEVTAAAGIPQVAWIGLRDSELAGAGAAVERAGLRYPLFVKPANLGSSVGVTKAHDPSELAAALAVAAEYDEWIVVEQGVVDGREIEVAVLGNQDPKASVPGEVIPGNEFYDYDDKYVDGTTQFRVPAPLDDELTEQVRSLAIQAYQALRCDGMARVDFFYEGGDGGRGFLLNEINTIPGFTPISMYPKLWEATGISYPELIDELVRLAVDRHERRGRFSTKR